ncbi:MAG: glycosyltransferase family 8 protein [Eubacteriales bacterium]
MNILFCGDSNIADGVLICTLSLMRHTSEPLHVYILTASVNTEKKKYTALDPRFSDFLGDLMRKKNEKSSARLFDITEKFNSMLPTANLETRFTPCCMLRLYADLVDGLPDRLLYLDNDIVCRGDPHELWQTNMDKTEIAGVLDYYGSHFFRKNIFRRDYLNSGVLMLNMQKIRESDLFARCRRLCRDKEMFMPDQSALNKLAEKVILPRRFNEQRIEKPDTVLRHFSTTFRFFPRFRTVSVKPWNIKGMHEILKVTEYDGLLDEYLLIKENYK